MYLVFIYRNKIGKQRIINSNYFPNGKLTMAS